MGLETGKAMDRHPDLIDSLLCWLFGITSIGVTLWYGTSVMFPTLGLF
ncbi:MAG: hypothetical protein H6R10_2195 [Rhodocyclaceae bacterium]|nr:hypothetical protein [Rhodocyclaceae bacterium]